MKEIRKNMNIPILVGRIMANGKIGDKARKLCKRISSFTSVINFMEI